MFGPPGGGPKPTGCDGLAAAKSSPSALKAGAENYHRQTRYIPPYGYSIHSRPVEGVSIGDLYEAGDLMDPTLCRSRRPFLTNAVLPLTAALALTGAGLSTTPASAAVPSAAPALAAASPAASTTEQQEFQLLDLINQDRARNGLQLLRMEPTLQNYARHHATDEANAGTIWHNMDELKQWAPAGWSGLGENVAYNYSILAMHQAYMNSPPHRANILNPAFNYVGIGIVATPDGRLYNSEDFMGKTDQDLSTVSAPNQAPSSPASSPSPTPKANSAPAPKTTPAPTTKTTPAPTTKTTPASTPKTTSSPVSKPGGHVVGMPPAVISSPVAPFRHLIPQFPAPPSAPKPPPVVVVLPPFPVLPTFPLFPTFSPSGLSI